MLKLMSTSLQIRFSITANRFLHFLRRIPLIKRGVSASVYGNYSMKTGIAALGFFFIVAKRVMIRFLFVGALVLFGNIFWFVSSLGGFGNLIHRILAGTGFSLPQISYLEVIPFVLTFWFLCLTGSFRITNLSKQDVILLHYLKVNPKEYAKCIIVMDRVVDVCLYLPYYIVVILMTGLPFWSVLVMTFLQTSVRLLGESVLLLHFHYKKKTRFSYLMQALVIVLFLTVFLTRPNWLGTLDWTAILSNPFVALTSVLVGAFSIRYLDRYSDYTAFFQERIRILNDVAEALKKNKKNKNLNLDSVKKWNAEIEEEDLKSNRYENKSGFSYLNAIFFDRHAKFFKKKLIVRCVGIVLVGIAVLLFGIGYTMYKKTPFMADVTEASYFDFAPVFFFIIYCISMGRVVTASVFSNCDIEMLHYPYYRKKDKIFSSFKARLAYILRYNVIITTTLSFSAIIGAGSLYGGMDSLYAGVFFLLMTCIGVFFAFNDLFLYYAIQPYDSKGQSKSVTYSIINGVIYFISYMNFSSFDDFDMNLLTYSTVVILLIGVYMGIGTGALFLFAPKNYKLR